MKVSPIDNVDIWMEHLTHAHTELMVQQRSDRHMRTRRRTWTYHPSSCRSVLMGDLTVIALMDHWQLNRHRKSGRIKRGFSFKAEDTYWRCNVLQKQGSPFKLTCQMLIIYERRLLVCLRVDTWLQNRSWRLLMPPMHLWLAPPSHPRTRRCIIALQANASALVEIILRLLERIIAVKNTR